MKQQIAGLGLHSLGPAALTRRGFLRAAAGGASLAATAAMAAACGSGTTTSPTASTQALKPKRGGQLRAGFSGASSADNLNPLSLPTESSLSYCAQLFDSLIVYNADAQPQLSLASEISPNSDATVWTIRLKPGITFHNGKNLTADDVIYTFQTIVDPSNPQTSAPLLKSLLASEMRKLDPLTARLTFATPYSTFSEMLSISNEFGIVPVGFDPKKPVGTGPFRYQTFTPGVAAEFARYDGYWQEGLPYVDSVSFSAVPDESTQVNGILAGQYDIVDFLSAPSIAPVSNGGAEILISPGGSYNPFTMRCDEGPFADVNVRQAFRLLVDRDQMREVVFGGHGVIGNDLYSIWDSVYDHQLPQREQDIPQAKYLLKKAGMEGIKVSLATAPIAQGAVSMATVFAGNANAAGVKVSIDSMPTVTLYGPNYLKWQFAQDFWPYVPYFCQTGEASLPTSPYNETHWNNPSFLALYNEALKTTNVALRTEIAHRMQEIYYDQGGYIIPCFSPGIDGFSKRVHGDVVSKVGHPFNTYDLKSLWLD